MKLLSTLIIPALIALILLPWQAAWAVEGVSVTVHWDKVNENFWGGYGQIMRHDIVNSEVVHRETLHAGPARNVVISPDGTQVAFIKDTGMLSVMSIDGGEVDELVQTQSTAHLDWPQQDWIFYNLGGIEQPDISRVLNAVNPATGGIREIVTLNRGVWRFFIARDLRRAVVRVDDQDIEPSMTIIAYDMVDDEDTLRADRSPGRPSCGTGMDPDGAYFMAGVDSAHWGLKILDWESFAEVKAFSHFEALSWGGKDSGMSHNRNNWSVNSSRWISVHLGWGFRGVEGANQVLYNWVDEERIVVTENEEGSREFDSAGDFFVKLGLTEPLAPVIRFQPEDLAARRGEDVTLSVIVAGDGPLAYQWQREGKNIPGADSPALVLKGVGSDLSESTYRCLIFYGRETLVSNAATLFVTEVENLPPAVVMAVGELTAYLHAAVLLSGTVEDDGLPEGRLTTAWRMLSGPQDPRIEFAEQQSTKAIFDEPGIYVMRLEASDGVLTAHEDVTVMVREAISVVTPEAHDILAPGPTQIYWRTAAPAIEAVELQVSMDGQQSWRTIETVSREADSWGRVIWDVPAKASSDCFIRITSVGAAPGFQGLAGPFTVKPDGGCAVSGAGPLGGVAGVLLAAAGLLLLLGARRSAASRLSRKNS